MPQSLARVITHIIFSTKNREPMIPAGLRSELNAYLGGVLREFDSRPIQIDNMPDHVHILCCLSRKFALSKVIEEVKKASSKWMKTKSQRLRGFYWQGGYGASSVSQSNVKVVRKYIADQEQHHRKMTFQDELRAFLKKHRIEYDERYVWD
ncbi:MAG: transposase [Planctomycetes bacterium DG_58]|nr:MAG: transposase [Planctomycetes bacterium DG_58]